MISRRTVIAGATALGLAPQSFAKTGDLSPPPHLHDLQGLALTLPDGRATLLGEHLAAGRAAVISLWATWCAPCAMEASHLGDLRRSIDPSRLDIAGINVDSQRDEMKIAAFLKRAKADFVQLRGDPLPTYAAFNGQPPISLPRLYIFSTAGEPLKAFGRYSGKSTLRQIDDAIATAMAV